MSEKINSKCFNCKVRAVDAITRLEEYLDAPMCVTCYKEFRDGHYCEVYSKFSNIQLTWLMLYQFIDEVSYNERDINLMKQTAKQELERRNKLLH